MNSQQLQKTPSPSKARTPSSLRRSVQKVKEMTQRDFFNKRYSKVKEFLGYQKIDINQYLSEREILNFLDTLGRETFNREIAKQLFDKIPSRPNPYSANEKIYNVSDFMEAHIRAEYLLLLQAEETEKELDKIYSQIEQLKLQYQELLMNPQIAGESSSLHLEVLEVTSENKQNILPPGSSYSVIILCDNYKYETEEIKLAPNQQTIAFNHAFHIRVSSSDQTFKMMLRDHTRKRLDRDYKDLTCVVSLSKYQDSKKHDVWLTLSDANGNPSQVRVHINLSYAFSKTSFFEETIKRLMKIEERLLENRNNIEYSLRELVYPFAHPTPVS